VKLEEHVLSVLSAKKDVMCSHLRVGNSWKSIKIIQDEISMLKSGLMKLVIRGKLWKSCSQSNSVRTVVLKVSLSFLLFLALVGLFSHYVFIVRGADEATSSVEAADLALRKAFNATLDAEKAGANVSGLSLRLNEAGDALEKAQNALRNGDSSGAVDNASLCKSIAENVSSDAIAWKTSALVQAQFVFWNDLTFSVVGLEVYITALVLAWAWFKRRYAQKTRGLKSEVTPYVEA
jgi:hypothetical protein